MLNKPYLSDAVSSGQQADEVVDEYVVYGLGVELCLQAGAGVGHVGLHQSAQQAADVGTQTQNCASSNSAKRVESVLFTDGTSLDKVFI